MRKRMGFLARSTNVLSWSPPVVGSPCHVLSLTADEGTWVKLDDFREHVNVVFLFVSSIQNDANNEWLKEFNRYTEQFESLETVVYGVNTARTDELRAHRIALGIDFFLLYDPLAIESRAMRCSSRVAPICKTTAVVVGKDGTVLYSERGHAPPSAILTVLAKAEGLDEVDLQPVSDAGARAYGVVPVVPSPLSIDLRIYQRRAARTRVHTSPHCTLLHAYRL